MSKKYSRKKSTEKRKTTGKTNSFFQNILALPTTGETEPLWIRGLLPLLAIAYLLRATVALWGDFVIHPDEIMQYLEPAHSLVFGSGFSFWEYYYGARSWLVPGLVAIVLWFCSLVGLGEPTYYIAGVKLMFCAISLLIPFSLYICGRHLFSERTGQIALLLSIFWYELIGFAHKPMTEFLASSVLFSLLAVVVSPTLNINRRSSIAVILGVLVVAIRFQYAPVVALILLADFIRIDNRGKLISVIVGITSVLCIGIFEWLTWGQVFHSYWLNLKANLVLGAGREGESTPFHFLMWLTLASGGIFLIVLVTLFRHYSRYSFLILLLLALLLPHMFQAHREYRFIFAAIPFCLLIFSDWIVSVKFKKNIMLRKLFPALSLSTVGLISLAGIMNFLPFQHWVYQAYSNEKGVVNFIRNQDPLFQIYRNLAKKSNLSGVWDTVHSHFNTGGYYYLHQSVPFYWGKSSGFFSALDAKEYVSHIIAGPSFDATKARAVAFQGQQVLEIEKDQYTRLPYLLNDANQNLVYWDQNGQQTVLKDFSLEEEMGALSVWKQENPIIHRWKNYRIYPDNEVMHPYVLKAIGDQAKAPTKNFGIDFE